MRDYINSIDMKMDNQNLEVTNAVEYMTTNLSQSITELLTEMKNSGELDEILSFLKPTEFAIIVTHAIINALTDEGLNPHIPQ